MREYLETIDSWIKDDRKICIARVIKTWGSSPRPMGSIMLINDHGQMAGSVSGGCVEGAVVKASQEVFESGVPKKLDFGVSDDDAWSVGLSCGGRVEVFLEPFMATLADRSEMWERLEDNLSSNESSILVSSMEETKNISTLVSANGDTLGDTVDQKIINHALEAFNQRTNKIVEEGDKQYFIQVFPKKSLLLIIGAAHITVDLVELGKMYGFETVVIDPRGFFAQNTSFKTPPDKLIEAYPSEVLDRYSLDAYTYAIILSHDPKIDDNALEILLPSDVGYIGALGSRKTHAKRVARLEDRFSKEQIERINAPIGMPIKAKSASEIALSIMGEIIQTKNEFV